MKLKYFLLVIILFTTAFSGIAEDIAALRTSKKIIRMDKAVEPYYAIQIIALKKPPGVASFFTNIEQAREYPCADGFYRFCVGQYSSYAEAKSNLQSIRGLGYDQAFVVNTAEFDLGQGRPVARTSKKIDPNRMYTVQLSAFRFPVYLSHFKDLENVTEYRMKDKIFRYCISEVMGTDAAAELARIKSLGYKDAYLVELDKYAPFKIE